MLFVLKRIFEAQREDEHFKDISEAKEKLIVRQKSDRLRYVKYYGLDCFDHKYYDFVLNSHGVSPEELVEQIMSYLSTKE